MPVFMPKPPVGVNRCTASPANSTRLVAKRSATSATPAVQGQWPMMLTGRSAPTERSDERGTAFSSVGGEPSSGALEKARNSSSSLSEMMVQRPCGWTIQ